MPRKKRDDFDREFDFNEAARYWDSPRSNSPISDTDSTNDTEPLPRTGENFDEAFAAEQNSEYTAKVREYIRTVLDCDADNSKPRFAEMSPDERDRVANAIAANKFLSNSPEDGYKVVLEQLPALRDNSGSYGTAVPVKKAGREFYTKIVMPSRNRHYNFENEYHDFWADGTNIPNIVRIFDYSTYSVPRDDGSGNLDGVVLLMEKLRPLSEITFDRKELLKLAIDVCKGIVYLQSRGIIHRDIRPANIMYRLEPDNSRTYVLIDLGLLIRADSEGNAPHDNMCVSPNYAPPEVSSKSGPDSYRAYNSTTDTYMLATTLIHLATNISNCRIDDGISEALRELNSAINDLKESTGYLDFSMDYIYSKIGSRFRLDMLKPTAASPVDLVRIIEKCCSNRIDNRPKNAEELYGYLNGIQRVPVVGVNGFTDSYHKPIPTDIRKKNKYSITKEGVLGFPAGFILTASCFDSISLYDMERETNASLIYTALQRGGIHIKSRLITEDRRGSTASYSVNIDNISYVLRCISCYGNYGETSSSELIQNGEAYAKCSTSGTCKVHDIVKVQYNNPNDSPRYFLLVLSQFYDAAVYTPLSSLLDKYGSDYRRFSAAERCVICLKAIGFALGLHSNSLYHGAISASSILVRRNTNAPHFAEVHIAGYGNVCEKGTNDHVSLARVLIETLTNRGEIALNMLPVKGDIRDYVISLAKELDRSGNSFKFEVFDEQYLENYPCIPMTYRHNGGIVFTGDSDTPDWKYSVSFIQGDVNASISLPTANQRDTVVPVPKDWGVTLRMYVDTEAEQDYLYAFCTDTSNGKYMVKVEGRVLSSRNSEKLLPGSVIECFKRSKFWCGWRSIGKLTVASVNIH